MKILLMICLLLGLSQTCFAEKESYIDKEQVRRAVRSHMKDFRDCFDAEYKKDSKLAGKMVLQWEVLDTGVVQNIKLVETALNNPNVENCVMDIIKKVQFPNALKGKKAEIKYPFVFQKGMVQF